MTEDFAISLDRVSKRFEFVADKPQSVLETIIATLSRKNRQSKQDLWALRDISFTASAGESLGIIGRNGSGKSTILKLAAGIIRPSSGRVLVRGRLSALLELGAGFHQDLTGQENIYLNASILGMSEKETAECFDSIVEFSELGDFIHMPVKHYSSGMYMRLGFSVAVHVNPNVLLVDEILAVGDQSFQNKCIDKIYDLQRHGATIIFISHNLETVRALCSKLIWIEDGLIQASGEVGMVIDKYLDSQESRLILQNGQTIHNRWGSYEIELTNVRLLDAEGLERDEFVVGEAMTIEMSYTAHEAINEPEFGLAFFRQDGIYISGPDNQLAGSHMGVVEGSGVVRYQVKQLPLQPTVYYLTAAIYDTNGLKPYDHHDKGYKFRVTASGERPRKGLVELPGEWEWVKEESPSMMAG